MVGTPEVLRIAYALCHQAMCHQLVLDVKACYSASPPLLGERLDTQPGAGK